MGAQHSCALQSDNKLVCWGSNKDGQISVPAAQPTSGAADAGVISEKGVWANVSAGHYHTCAIKLDGEVECFGYNDWGQTQVPTGLYVADLCHESAFNFICSSKSPAPLEGFSQVICGFDFTCAITSRSRAVCWGRNNFGQVNVPRGLCAPAGDIVQNETGDAMERVIPSYDGCLCSPSGCICAGPPRIELSSISRNLPSHMEFRILAALMVTVFIVQTLL